MGLSIMTKIDRQDNIAHLHRHIRTYPLNIHTEMYTGNYREAYQSAGISPSLNACEQASTGGDPGLLSLYISFFPSHVSFLLPVSFVCSLTHMYRVHTHTHREILSYVLSAFNCLPGIICTKGLQTPFSCQKILSIFNLYFSSGTLRLLSNQIAADKRGM